MDDCRNITITFHVHRDLSPDDLAMRINKVLGDAQILQEGEGVYKQDGEDMFIVSPAMSYATPYYQPN